MNNKIGFFLNLDQGSMTNQEVVATLAQVGYRCIEYSIRHMNPHTMSQGKLREFVQMAEQGGLEISEWVVQREFVHRDESVRKKELQLSIDCIKAAGDLGIGVVNCYTGPAPFMDLGSPVLHQEISEGDAWDMVLDACDKIIPVAEQAGVKIAVEAVYGMVCREYYTLADLLNRYDSPNFGVNYDPSHMELHYNTVEWTIHKLKDRIFHVHVKDVAGTPGKFMNDTFIFPFLGEGRVDWQGFFCAMQGIDFKGTLSIECETFNYYESAAKKDLTWIAKTFYRDYLNLEDMYSSG